MSKLTDLLKKHSLTTISYGQNGGGKMLDRAVLVKLYGDQLRCESYYASVPCPIEDEHGKHYSHSFYAQQDGSMAYSWPGQGYVVSKGLLPIDVLHEIIHTKKAELADARRKRFEKVKTPRDALRVTFRDLGIKANMVQGVPRVDCGPFELEFFADTENPQVKVTMVYQSHYVNKIELITLTIADPSFNKKVEAIVTNGKNLKKLMLGETQPKSLES